MSASPSVYNRNSQLKARGVAIAWEQWQVDEFSRCADDPIYFIEKYIKIITVDDGEQPMILFPYQKDIVNSLQTHRKTAAIICRQAGKTTVVAAFVCWFVLFNDAKTVAILANKAGIAREILKRVQYAYERVPQWMQQGVVEWNKGSFVLENDSRVMAASTSSTAIRGMTANLLLMDEFAFVPNNVADEFFASVYPTIASGKTSKIAIISTPNGMNHFYKIIKEGEAGVNGFHITKAIWSDVPGRDSTWERDMRATLGNEKFEQEMNCEFIGSSNTLIPSAVLRALLAIPPKASSDKLKVFEESKPDSIYVMTVDVAKGLGGDCSVATVFDITQAPYKVVAQFADNLITYVELPSVLHRMAVQYNNCYVLVEANNIGETVAMSLYEDLGYENIFHSDRHKLTYSTKDPYGITTTNRTKSVGCVTLKTLLDGGQLDILDVDTILELSKFVRSKGSFAADGSGNDDRVMTLVLFAYLTSQPVFNDLTDSSAMKKILENKESAMAEEMLPLGGFSDGTESDDVGNIWD